jgi:pimeloyl-ACP methyl ester carboxylesterase
VSAGALQPVRIAVQGRQLAGVRGGAGELFVLLETGLGAPASDWQAVAEGIAGFARVGWYERAGRGESEPAPRPRGPDVLVADLQAVLQAFEARSPCILVGQSFGGLLARLYAHAHPQALAGLVLVDAMHEDQFDTCGPLLPPPAEGEPAPLAAMRRFWQGGWRDPANNEEGLDLLACLEAARQVRSLGALPLRILTASGWTCPPRLPPAFAQPLQRARDGLQARLETLSTQARREQLPQSGHFVQQDQPQAVVAAVRELSRGLGFVQ